MIDEQPSMPLPEAQQSVQEPRRRRSSRPRPRPSYAPTPPQPQIIYVQAPDAPPQPPQRPIVVPAPQPDAVDKNEFRVPKAVVWLVLALVLLGVLVALVVMIAKTNSTLQNLRRSGSFGAGAGVDRIPALGQSDKIIALLQELVSHRGGV